MLVFKLNIFRPPKDPQENLENIKTKLTKNKK